MNKDELNKLSKSELIEKLLKFEVEVKALKKLKTQPRSPPPPSPSPSPSPSPPKTYQELNKLNFYQLRNYAKSIKGIGKYGNLKKNELIELILSKSKVKPKVQVQVQVKKKRKVKVKAKPKTYQELHNHLLQLNFYELRKYAKSIRGIGKYGNLKKNELIELILKSFKPTPTPRSKKVLKRKLKLKVLEKVLKKVKPIYQELNKLNFYQLRKYAKSIKGIGKYGNLNKNELIKLILKSFKPTPAPRTKKVKKVKPKIEPRTKITQLDQALKGYTKSYEISIKNNKDPLLQLQNTRLALASHISSLLTSMNGLKFLEALKVSLSKISDGETVYRTPVFFSKPQTIINNTEIKASLEATQQKILNNIAIWISEGSGWTIESVDNHYLNVVTFQPLAG